MARAPEGADSQVEKDRRGDDGKIAGNGVAAESGPVLPQAQGFRQFLLRGYEKVRGEWALACTSHNLPKVYRVGMV